MFLPLDFAKNGLHVARAGNTPISRYQVIGERSSGTNFVKRLLGRNSNLRPTEGLGWKHGFMHMMAVPADMAVICVTRSADSWARSMFAKPWHTTREMQALPFSEFIRAEWNTIIDRPRYFGDLIDKGSVGAPLQHDRDPQTGRRFNNLFALRKAKLMSHLSILNRNCSCVIVRMETAQADPEATRDAILHGLGLEPHDAPFRNVVKRLGSKFKPVIPTRPELPLAWSREDSCFLHAQIDPMWETALGYDYSSVFAQS